MKRLCEHIESLEWSEAVALLRASHARETFAAAIPSLGELLHAGASYFKGITFRKVEYQYGDLIINQGRFQMPKREKVCEECQKLQDEYSNLRTVPLQLVLGNNLEVFLLCKDQVVHLKKQVTKHERKEAIKPGYRMVPVDTRRPGDLIGLFETLRPLVGRSAHYGSFYVSAGSRNVSITLPLAYDCDLLKKVNRESLQVYLEADIKEYLSDRPLDADWSGISHVWRLIREALHSRPWSSSVLLFPSELHHGSEYQFPGAAEWRDRLLLHLFGEAWSQSQNAIEAFVPDDDSDVLERPSRYFLSIDEVSAPVVLQHLTSALDGLSMVLKPAAGAENGPFEEFVRWCTDQGDGEQTDGYLPLVLEPGRLSADSDWGIFSFAHPFIPTSLRIKHRTDSHPDLVEGLKDAIHRLKIHEYVQIQGRRRGEEISKSTFDQVHAWLARMGTRHCRGDEADKLARDRALAEYAVLEYRGKPTTVPG